MSLLSDLENILWLLLGSKLSWHRYFYTVIVNTQRTDHWSGLQVRSIGFLCQIFNKLRKQCRNNVLEEGNVYSQMTLCSLFCKLFMLYDIIVCQQTGKVINNLAWSRIPRVCKSEKVHKGIV